MTDSGVNKCDWWSTATDHDLLDSIEEQRTLRYSVILSGVFKISEH